jgi:peroxiredoxin
VLQDVSGRSVSIPQAPGRGEPALVHLQFRRFAGCPVCNLHLRSFARRHHELEVAGVREVVLFHSPADELRPHTADFPFAIVADPDKRLYAEFGVESSPRALLDPRAWLPILRAIAFALVGIVTGTVRLPAARPHGGRLGLPADFLIAPDGRVVACKRGAHVEDHWSLDDVLAQARAWHEKCPSELAGAD